MNKEEAKTGHWIDTNSDKFISHRVYKCSECDTIEIEYPENIYRHFRYCPNCGAEMSEPQDTETWNGMHGQITAPRGTFERIFNDVVDDNDI